MAVDSKPPDKKDPHWGEYGLALMIPPLMMAGPMVGYGLGYLAQKHLHWGDWAPLAGLFLGFMAAIREIIVILKKISKDTR